MVFRTGIGFDAHRFCPESPCWVAGLLFDQESQGLAGHSDGDVVAHAICDALFTAAGLGDMGSNYGTSDPKWANASGVSFLVETVSRLAAAGFSVVNVSAQLIGNRPKVGPRRAEAEKVLSQAVGAPVTLAATTTDLMGFTGRGEGLAAMAVALVESD